MMNKFMCVVAIVSAMAGMMVFAQEPTTKAGEGTLMLDKKNFPLKHALAYEMTIDNEQVIAVVLSGQAVSSQTALAIAQAFSGAFGRRILVEDIEGLNVVP